MGHQKIWIWSNQRWITLIQKFLSAFLFQIILYAIIFIIAVINHTKTILEQLGKETEDELEFNNGLRAKLSTEKASTVAEEEMKTIQFQNFGAEDRADLEPSCRRRGSHHSQKKVSRILQESLLSAACNS